MSTAARRITNWLSPQARGLVALYPFNESVGSQVYDRAKNNHGTIGNFNTSCWETTNQGKSLYVNDTSQQFVSVANSAALALTSFTISMRFLKKRNNVYERLCMKQNSGTGGNEWVVWGFQISDTNKLQMLVGPTGALENYYAQGLSSLNTLNQFYTVAITYSSADSKARGYINGGQDFEARLGSTGSDSGTLWSGNLATSTGNMHFGKVQWGGSSTAWANLVFGEARIYNRALTQSEIADIYANPQKLQQHTNSLADYMLKLLVLSEAIATTTADSLVLQATNLLSLGLVNATPIADALTLTSALELLLDTALATPTASPLAIQQAAALICMDALAVPFADSAVIAQALLLVLESAGSIPTAVPLTLSGLIALNLAQATATPTADDVILRADLQLLLAQAISTPFANPLALADVLIGLGKLINPNLVSASPLLGVALATPKRTLRNVNG